jgi:VWFA-related protein
VDFTIRWTDESREPTPEGGHAGKVRVELIVFDHDGKALNWGGGTLDLNVKDTAAYSAIQRSGVPARFEIDVPKGDTYLATGVYDWTSNKAGTLEIPLTGLKSVTAAQPPDPPGPRASEVPKELLHRTPDSVEQEQRALRHITLDVVVTDPTGKAIGDLQQQDFTLLDNAKPLPVTSFREIEGRTAQPADEAILLIDAMNPTFQDVILERQGVEKYLRQNGGHLTLPVSIVFLSDAGVKLNQPSRDGNALAADIEKLPATMRQLDSAQGGYGSLERLQRSIHTLTQLSTYEATKPGRKLLLWIGSGWPLMTGPELLVSPKNQNRFFASIVDVNTKLRQAHMTLYSVASLALSQGITELRTFVYQDYLKGVENAKQADPPHLAVQVLASQSGGQVLNGNGDLAAQIALCVADSDRYYEISFDAAPASNANEYHKLKIKLDKAGLTVRTNQEYYLQP